MIVGPRQPDVRFQEANNFGWAADMVKVFGCRPSQVVRLGSGRRTETFTFCDVPRNVTDGRFRPGNGSSRATSSFDCSFDL
jgi:hypothetical protein